MRHLIPSFIKVAAIGWFAFILGVKNADAAAAAIAPETAQLDSINSSHLKPRVSRHKTCDLDVPVPIKGTTAPDFSHVDLAPSFNRARAETLSRWWTKTCPDLSHQDVPRFKEDNLVCRIQGQSDEVIVVGAHYDKVSAGKGVADNWSGVVLIDALMKIFLSSKPRHTIDFVAFAAEEPGLFGSKAYLDQAVTKPILMINLDTIGLGPLIVSADSDPRLTCDAVRTAKSLQINATVIRWNHIGGDWQRFAKQGIPSLSLHSVDKRTIRRIHHRRDKAGNVDTQHLEDAYKLTYELLYDRSTKLSPAIAD